MRRNIIPKDQLVHLYHEKKKTDLEIAKIFHCTKGTVYNTRKRFGIKRLKRWERNICHPTEEQLQILYGTLLGDASLTNGTKSSYRCESILEVKHSFKQKQYLFWKHKMLASLCASKPKQLKNKQWRIRTFHHPYFSQLRQEWYPHGVKCLKSIDWSKLTLLSVAVWYMDDGSLSKSSNFIRLHTCSFTKSDHIILSEWLLKQYGISSYMREYDGYRNLVIDIDSRLEFVNMIKPFVISSMSYKTTFREYDRWVN